MRFFTVQERAKGAASSVPWSFADKDKLATAEDAFRLRDGFRAANGANEYRAVAVHVTAEIEVLE